MNFEITSGFIYATLIVFCRIGTICMFLPGIGEAFVPTSVRLMFALLLSFAIAANINIPVIPNSNPEFILLVLNELAIGLCIGISIKIIQSSLHVFGMIFASQAGLSSGMMFDPTQSTQGSSYGNMVSMCFVTLLLTSNLHLEIIHALRHSYDVFKFNFFLHHHTDLVNLIIRCSSDSFNVGVHMAAPFIVIGTLVNLGGGVLSRLMPQMQVFFIVLPAQIVIHTSILIMTFGGTLIWFIDYFQQYLINILK